ncbi:hypothetical protein [uncultured Dechloromonas sp.]|uniref:hypothetical protein n=1 Tax=uncultured Dechloromonas sp. TaxID=171719 RepID=UPI0025F8B279|nr:hypothetical protein [uncultured Dechloromonas sp.]
MEAIDRSAAMEASNATVLSKLNELYREAFAHDGFAELKVEFRILRRGQKEVILHCGKQYRYVIDYRPGNPLDWELRREKSGTPPRAERRKHQEAISFSDRRKAHKS